MFFEQRHYQVRAVKDAAELAKLLTQYTWCGCTGFAYGGALFLNDSSSADGAQEYALCTLDGVQVDSVTFGWMSKDQAEAFLVDCLPDIVTGRTPVMQRTVPIHIDTYQDHGRCRHCA